MSETIDREKAAVMLLATVLEMSDDAQKLGGATSIAGVASLHRLQTSIQKNRGRIIKMLQLQLRDNQS